MGLLNVTLKLLSWSALLFLLSRCLLLTIHIITNVIIVTTATIDNELDSIIIQLLLSWIVLFGGLDVKWYGI